MRDAIQNPQHSKLMPNRVTEPVVLRVRRLVTLQSTCRRVFRREAYARNLTHDGALLSGIDDP